MPRLGCDTRIEKSSVDIADRVYDLRNRVAWLKNVEYCLFGDQNERLNNIKTERYDIEASNNDLRKNLKKEITPDQHDEHMTNVKRIERMFDKRNQIMKEHNKLLYVKKHLLERLRSLEDQSRYEQNDGKAISLPNKQIQDTNTVMRTIREKQNRLKSVKLINKTLNLCKQHLECDLELLRKELPHAHKDIGHKFHQKMLLKHEFIAIVHENKRRLKTYQQLLNHIEVKNRQRRAIHEQAMNVVSEQLDDQYQMQMMAINERTSSFESKTFANDTDAVKSPQHKPLATMNNDEIMQVHFMYDQFYNMIIAGLPIDISNAEQLRTMVIDVSSKTSAMLTMANRMMEEKEQLAQQINRIDNLSNLIKMSMDIKNDTRQKILCTMIEQRQTLESLCLTDTIEDQNRIIRQINDFILVLSKVLCDYTGTQFTIEPSFDFLQRLQYVFELMVKTVKTVTSEYVNENDHQISLFTRHNDIEDNIQRNFEILKGSRSLDRSTTSSISSLSSRIKRSSLKYNIY